MKSQQSPQSWHAPQWHLDHGDPVIELEHLRSFALKLVDTVPEATAILEVPEPGLMDVRVELARGLVAEVYSVPSLEDQRQRRFAIFLCPDTENESEIYAESPEDASNLFGLLASSPQNGARTDPRSATELHSHS